MTNGVISEAYIKETYVFPNGRFLSSIHTSRTMASKYPVILILGSGPNVGHYVARAFVAKGYKVALASRSAKEEDSNADQVHISTDLSDPRSVKDIFLKVEASLGLPSVVVYNGEHVPHGSPLTKPR
jgi:NAD(P)-dependent dehydrogenase (short-subunit alcohol dehydrogenase family)